MGSYCSQALGLIERLSPQEWFYVLVGVIVAGFVFLRGFGSRTGY